MWASPGPEGSADIYFSSGMVESERGFRDAAGSFDDAPFHTSVWSIPHIFPNFSQLQ